LFSVRVVLYHVMQMLSQNVFVIMVNQTKVQIFFSCNPDEVMSMDQTIWIILLNYFTNILPFTGKSEHAGQHCESSWVWFNGHKWSCSLRQDSSVPWGWELKLRLLFFSFLSILFGNQVHFSTTKCLFYFKRYTCWQPGTPCTPDKDHPIHPD